MTPDTLRQGAALVRCLGAGDESARLPLSDWILEHGLPGMEDRFARETVAVLRDTTDYTALHAARYTESGLVNLTGWCRSLHMQGPLCWLGYWPAWVWQQEEVTT